MRINKQQVSFTNDYKLMIVDDDAGLIDSIASYLARYGYNICGLTDPTGGLERLKEEKFDLLILDYFMYPIKGDDFVSKLREFDRDLYVILLTGHKDLAPPFATIKAFDIQAYCEKSHKLDQLMLLIESGLKSINQRFRITNYRDSLHDILSALPEIYRLNTPEAMLKGAIEKIISLTGHPDVFAMIDVLRVGGQLIYRGGGKYDDAPETVLAGLPGELAGAIDKAKKTHGIVPIEGGLVFPVIGRNEYYEGVVYVEGMLEEDDMNILEIFVINAAALIHNAYLNEALSHAYSNLKSSFVETIEALRLAVDAKDVYTRGHSDRVSKLSQLIGRKFNLGEEELEELRIAGLFHDIGKIGISDEVLLKDSALTPEEFAEIRKHPMKGAMILSAVSAFDKIKQNVCWHHEYVNGEGYPDGLKGDEIPLGARIISVADAYDAMAFDRHYRQKLSRKVALNQLKVGSGKQFDSEVVDSFLSILEDSPDEITALFN